MTLMDMFAHKYKIQVFTLPRGRVSGSEFHNIPVMVFKPMQVGSYTFRLIVTEEIISEEFTSNLDYTFNVINCQFNNIFTENFSSMNDWTITNEPL